MFYQLFILMGPGDSVERGGSARSQDGVVVYYLNVQSAGTQLDHEPSR